MIASPGMLACPYVCRPSACCACFVPVCRVSRRSAFRCASATASSATGDVLVDPLLLMERTALSSAVPDNDTDLAAARPQLDRFPGFYPRNAETTLPPRDAAPPAGK